MDNSDIAYIENNNYSDEVLWAVRYGYLYRIEAEKQDEDGTSYHFCLDNVSDILLWIGKLVIDGLAFNLIDKYVKQLWEKIMSMRIEIPDDVNKLLLEEDELRKFVSYVSEFKNKQLSTTPKQTKYIRDEIIADYVGKAAGEIWSKEKRLPTQKELIRIDAEAAEFADNLILE